MQSFARLALTVGFALVVPVAAGAAQSGCNAPAKEPSVVIEMPGSPFLALPTNDGCWVFVSIGAGGPRRPGEVAVVHREGGKLKVERTIKIDGGPTGMALTRDESLLIVAAGDGIAFIDVGRAKSGKGKPVLGLMKDGGIGVGRIYATATADGKIAFISDERTQSITVIDLDKATSNGFRASAIIGKIPVGNAPVGLAITPDGKHMLTTSQSVPLEARWPSDCKPEATNTGATSPVFHSKGAIYVVDVARASADPFHSVESVFPAGCNPVRIVLSPDGTRAYVSTRGMNELRVYDTKRVMSGDTTNALLAVIPVGIAPVGVAVIDSGRKVVVTSSNRFGGSNDPQDLLVVDVTQLGQGAKSVIGSILAGAFPRELRVTADGGTLLLTNFGSRTLQMIDLARLPIRPVQH